jgi:hypothetical protein
MDSTHAVREPRPVDFWMGDDADDWPHRKDPRFRLAKEYFYLRWISVGLDMGNPRSALNLRMTYVEEEIRKYTRDQMMEVLPEFYSLHVLELFW